MTELAKWEAEARKHDLHYGAYTAAVEVHGTLPPPKTERRYPAMQLPPPSRVCRLCGMEYEIWTTKSGRYSQGTLCQTCLESVRKECGNNMMSREITPTFVCEECGKTVERAYDELGRPKQQKICTACQVAHKRNTHPTKKCESCGKIFELKVSAGGNISVDRYCHSCQKSIIIKNRVALGNDKTRYVCNVCGGVFDKPIGSNGKPTARRLCDACGGGRIHKKKNTTVMPYTEGYSTHTRGR